MKPLNHLLILVAILTSTAAAAQTGPPDPRMDLDSLYTIWQDDTQADSTRVDASNLYAGSPALPSAA